MSFFNHVAHENGWFDKDNANSQKTSITIEERILKLLKDYEIGEVVDKTIFEPFLGETVISAVDKITKVSSSKFELTGKKIFGISAIDKNASISIMDKSKIVSPSNSKVYRVGVKITLSNLPNIKISYHNATHKFSEFVVKDNYIFYIFNNKLFDTDITGLK